MKIKNLIVLGLLVLLITSIAACQATPPEIFVDDAWGRSSPKVATAGAFYMVIRNAGGEADKLVSASSDACGTVELHESYDKGDGVMGMREVPDGFIEVPANGEVELKMGGLHIMCIDKLSNFDAGNVFSLTLNFEKTGEKQIDVPIKMPDM